MARILIVDDSPLAARHLASLFARDAAFVLLGVARNGVEGVAMAASLKPDVVCMDITMPDIDGFEATRRIMAASPVPIVIVSSTYEPRLVSMAFRALETGALAILAAVTTVESAGALLTAFRHNGAVEAAVERLGELLDEAPAAAGVNASPTLGLPCADLTLTPPQRLAVTGASGDVLAPSHAQRGAARGRRSAPARNGSRPTPAGSGRSPRPPRSVARRAIVARRARRCCADYS